MKSPKPNLSIYGIHRVLEPLRALPQSALKLNSTPRILNPHELLMDVDSLMLDATSMRQIRDAAQGDSSRMAKKIFGITCSRGKMHNPETNSGGVLIGKIREIGSRFFKVHPPHAGKHNRCSLDENTIAINLFHAANIKGQCRE